MIVVSGRATLFLVNQINRPASSFKIKAEVTNELGNKSSIISSALNVDFEPSKITKIVDNVSGIATGNITYTIDFDKDVLFFQLQCFKCEQWNYSKCFW